MNNMEYKFYKRFFREKPDKVWDYEKEDWTSNFDCELGKIESVDFGLSRGFLLGLKLTFHFGSCCGTFFDFSINMSDQCKWKDIEEKHIAGIEILQIIKDILDDAKVDDVQQLVNIPVEIYTDTMEVRGFRILKEVL